MSTDGKPAGEVIPVTSKVVGVSPLNGRRARLRALIDEMTATTRALRSRGIEPGQKEDREALVIVNRMIERAYLREK